MSKCGVILWRSECNNIRTCDYIFLLVNRSRRPFEFSLFVYFVSVLLPFETLFKPPAFKYTMQIVGSNAYILRVLPPLVFLNYLLRFIPHYETDNATNAMRKKRKKKIAAKPRRIFALLFFGFLYYMFFPFFFFFSNDVGFSVSFFLSFF